MANGSHHEHDYPRALGAERERSAGTHTAASLNWETVHGFTAIYADGGMYLGYPPRPDRMNPIGSYVLRGAGCHDNEHHVLHGASRHIWM
eukprot:5332506-Pleurochrysis_carterae.AAC.3